MKKFDPYNVDERKMSCGEAYKRLLVLYKTLQESLELRVSSQTASAEGDARIAELETVLNRTVIVVNTLPSITGLSPVRDYSGLPLAVADLQESYRDAARARNGMHTKMQTRAEAAEAKLRAVSDALDDGEQFDDIRLARIRAIVEGK